jgi:hypothetical protein
MAIRLLFAAGSAGGNCNEGMRAGNDAFALSLLGLVHRHVIPFLLLLSIAIVTISVSSPRTGS